MAFKEEERLSVFSDGELTGGKDQRASKEIHLQRLRWAESDTAGPVLETPRNAEEEIRKTGKEKAPVNIAEATNSHQSTNPPAIIGCSELNT